jgi:hypothetical protein
MRNFVFLIADGEMFVSSDELAKAMGEIIAYYFVQHGVGPENDFIDKALYVMGISAYRFAIPGDCADTDAGANVRANLATLIGRGIAFSNDWANCVTVSTVMEVMEEPADTVEEPGDKQVCYSAEWCPCPDDCDG